MNISFVQVLFSKLSATFCWKLASVSDDFLRSWQVADSRCVFDEDWKTSSNFLVREQETTVLSCCYIGVYLALRVTFKWVWMTDFFTLSLFTYTQNYGTCRIRRIGIELWKMIPHWIGPSDGFMVYIWKFASTCKTTRYDPENGVRLLLWNFVSHLQDYTVSQRTLAAATSRWFLACGFFYPEDRGDMFLRNVGSHKIYKAPDPIRRHSSWSPPWKPQIIRKEICSELSATWLACSDIWERRISGGCCDLRLPTRTRKNGP
jgi:hypothetical protein